MSRYPIQTPIDRYLQKSPRNSNLLAPPAHILLGSLPNTENRVSSPSTVIPLKRTLSNATNDPMKKPRINDSKSKEAAELRLMTGTVKKVQRWRSQFPRLVALWEIFANVIRIQCGKFSYEKLLLLRTYNTGPVMQVIYYEIDGTLPQNIIPGAFVRCVGRYVGTGNRFQVFKVRRLITDQPDQQEFVDRLAALSDLTVTAKFGPPSRLSPKM